MQASSSCSIVPFGCLFRVKVTHSTTDGNRVSMMTHVDDKFIDGRRSLNFKFQKNKILNVREIKFKKKILNFKILKF